MDPRLANLAPVPAINLLRAAIPFIVAVWKDKEMTPGARVQTIHHIMESWYVRSPKHSIDDIASYPTRIYCGACFSCGHIWDGNHGTLSSHCASCKALPSLSSHWLIDIICYRYKPIHPVVVEQLIIEYYYGRRSPGSRN